MKKLIPLILMGITLSACVISEDYPYRSNDVYGYGGYDYSYPYDRNSYYQEQYYYPATVIHSRSRDYGRPYYYNQHNNYRDNRYNHRDRDDNRNGYHRDDDRGHHGGGRRDDDRGHRNRDWDDRDHSEPPQQQREHYSSTKDAIHSVVREAKRNQKQ